MVNEKANVSVTVNNEKAKSELKELQSELQKLKQLRKEALDAGDVKTFQQLDKQFKSAGREAKKLEREINGVEATLRNINGASLEQLEQAQRALTQQTKKLNRETKEYAQKTALLKKVKTEIRGIKAETQQTASFMQRMTDGFNNYFGIVAAGVASLAGVQMTAQKAVDAANNREDVKGQVKALTNLSKQEIKYLEQQAIIAATTQTDTGIRIQKSADDIMKAYQLVGSAKPELLKNKEALAKVTEEILILAEASEGMDLSSAVDATTKAMNQYGAGADQAARFTNAMAAGSQLGAVAIPEIGEAIKVFGVNAKKANEPIEGSVSLIEVLGEKAGLVGPMAGTSLRNFFSILASGSAETNPEVVGLETALDNLNKKQMSTAEYTKMFGRETANVAQIIVSNKDYYKELKEQLIGTETAYKQAIDNTSDRKAKLNQAKAASHEYAVVIGQKLAPMHLRLVNTGKLTLKILSALIDLFKTYGTQIAIVVGAIGMYAAAMKVKMYWDNIHYALLIVKSKAIKAYTFATGVLTGKIKIATVVQKAWSAVMALNPIGLVVTAVAALAAGITILIKKMNEQTAAQKVLNEVDKTAQRSVIDHKLKVEDLLEVARDEKAALEDRKKALEQLNKISPEYFGNLSLETINSEAAKKATDDYIESLVIKARVQAAQEKLEELEKKRIDEEIEGSNKKVKWYQKMGSAIAANGNTAVYMALNTEKAQKNATKAQEEYNEEVAALKNIINENITEEQRAAMIKKKLGTDANEDEDDNNNGFDNKDSDVLKAIEIKHKKELLQLKKQMIEKGETDEWFKEQSLIAEIEYLEEKLKIQKQTGEETIDTEQTLFDKRLELADKYRLKKQEIDKLFDDLEKEDLELDDEGPEDNTKELERILEERKRLQEKYKTESQLLEEEHQFEMASLQSAYDLKLIAHEEFEKRKWEISQNYIVKRIDSEAKYLRAGEQLLSGFSEMYSAQKDAELAKAGENAEEKEAIERKFARKQQKIDQGQALIGGALGIINIWKGEITGNPLIDAVIKGVLTAALVATTAAQVSKIKAQQFYDGGYTGYGDKYEPAGIVHRGEFVGNQEAVNNPTVKPVFDIVNAAQKNGSISQLNLPAAIRASQNGFASGGYTSNSTAPTADVSNTGTGDNSDMAAVLILLANAANKLANKNLTISIKRFSDELEKYNRMQNDVDM